MTTNDFSIYPANTTATVKTTACTRQQLLYKKWGPLRVGGRVNYQLLHQRHHSLRFRQHSATDRLMMDTSLTKGKHNIDNTSIFKQ